MDVAYQFWHTDICFDPTHRKTQRKVALYRGVYPVNVENDKIGPVHVAQCVVDILINRKIVEKGQRIIMTRGNLIDEKGAGTNLMKIVDIED